MIPSSQILLNSRKSRIDGKQTYNDSKFKLSDTKMKKLEDSTMSLDEYIVMEQFAKYLPRGKRKLKLNMPELRDDLLSKRNLNQGTDTNGLRSGGLAARTGNLKAPPKKATKELEQKTMLFTIKNDNRLKTNPNYTSFKNNISLK
jgi:hypothetical protein